MNEDIKELLAAIESLDTNTTRYLICGKPEPVENIKRLIEENKEQLELYEFDFCTFEKLSKEYDDAVSILPLEMKRIISKFTGDTNEIEIS